MRDDIVKTRNLMIEHWKQMYRDNQKAKDRLDTIELYMKYADKIQKVNIKETFGFYRSLKDGTEGKILIFPDIEEMHTDEKYVRPWVEYSTFDAEITYFLRETLAYQLSCLETKEEGLSDMGALYAKYWLPFGELLTDMERIGIRIDLNHLKEAELTAERDKIEYEQKFL
jgi:DNA polymerase-1